MAGTRVNPASELESQPEGDSELVELGVSRGTSTRNPPGTWDPRALLTRDNPPGALESEAPSREGGYEREIPEPEN